MFFERKKLCHLLIQSVQTILFPSHHLRQTFFKKNGPNHEDQVFKNINSQLCLYLLRHIRRKHHPNSFVLV